MTHAGLMLDHFDLPRLAVLRKRHKKLQADKPAGPLNRGHERIRCRQIRVLRQVGNAYAESLGNTLRMAAEEDPAAHRNREPLVGIASDGISGFNAGQIMLELW